MMVKKKNHRLREEARKIISTSLITAFGLLMALTWKEVIAQYANELTTLSPIQGLFISAIIITIIGVIGILLVTKYFKKE